MKISRMTIVVLLLVSLAGFASAATRSTTITSDGAVLASPRVLCGVYGYTGGTNNLTIVLYENSTASGLRPIPPIVIVGNTYQAHFNIPALQVRELYVDLTSVGGGVVTIVHGQDSCE